MTPYGPTAVPLPAGRMLVAARGRDPAGHGSAPHRHPEGQLLGSLKGLLSVGADASVWVVPAIHAVWLPPHQAHWTRSHGPFDGWTVYVAEAACAQLPQTACTIRTSGLLREAVLRAAAWSAAPTSEADDRIAAVILDEICTLPVEPIALPLPRDQRLLKVARALIDDPADERDLDAWADVAAVSARTLSRRFVAETGFNFTAWKQRARMLRSLEMLVAGEPIGAVALDLGYATASAFIGAFRQTFGETPSAYRQKL